MAGVQIGALHISLSADSAAFDQGMDKVEDKSKSTTKNVEKNIEDMSDAIKDYAKDMALGLAAAFAVTNMAERIKEQIDYADSLADVAARSLQSAEALSAMEYALHFQDATLQDYTGGLQKLSENMAAASEGTKEQVLIFDTLGIKLRAQDGMLRNSGDVMLDFANKLSSMSDGATKTQLAMDVLGKSAGPALLPFLNQGKEGIEEFTAEAEKMGLVISTDFSNAAGELNDNLDKIAFRATAAWRVIAQELTPALIDLSNAMLRVNENGNRQASILGNIAAAGIRGLGAVITGAAEFGDLAVDATGKLMALGDVGVTAFTATGKAALDARNQFSGIWQSSSFIDNYTDALDRQKTVLFGLSDAEKALSTEKQNAAELDSLLTKFLGDEEVKDYEATKKRIADEAKAKEKLQANAIKNAQELQKVREKLLQDVIKLEESFFTVLDAENTTYTKNVKLINEAINKKIIGTKRGYEALQNLASEHNKKLEDIAKQEIDQIVTGWEAKFDAEKAYQDQVKAIREKAAADSKEGLDFVSGVILDGSGELARLDAAHNAKMTKLAELREAEKINDDEYFLTKEEAERQHAARRLDIQLGTGSAMTKLSDEFNKGMLKGALQFFASDFGGFAAHSRKVFEAQKAAKTAQILLNIPESVSNSYAAGTKIGGPIVGAAFAAAALASQLGQLKSIQSQSFGGSSVAGGAPSALPVTSSPTSQADQRAAEPSQTTYIRIPEDSILTGRKMLDFIDEALGDGKQLTNLRFIPA